MENDIIKLAVKWIAFIFIGLFATVFLMGCGAWDDITGTKAEEPIYNSVSNTGAGDVIIGNQNSVTAVTPAPVATPTPEVAE